MRHLITGGAGFIGSHLGDALVARGDEVVILDDLSTGRRENVEQLVDTGRADLVEGSVLDSKLVDDIMVSVDACFHLASAVGVQRVVEQPLASLLRNVRGTDVVMEVAARRDRRLLFTSTSEIYGKRSDGPLSEEADRVLGSPARSRWTYATAKAFGEMVALGYCRERGAEMTVARLFNAVGPRQVGSYGMVLPRFVDQALSGVDLTVYGDGTQSRCFTHVRDIVDAIVNLAQSQAALGRVFNVGSTTSITIRDLAQRVIDRSGSRSGIRLVPYDEAYDHGFEELGSRVPDTSSLISLCGWRPTRTIDDAIEEVVAYQRDVREAVGARG